MLSAGNAEVELLLRTARAEGFSGGLYVDFPHKGAAKKYFCCLVKGAGCRSEGQIWGNACSLALPLQCKHFSVSCPSIVLVAVYALSLSVRSLPDCASSA